MSSTEPSKSDRLRAIPSVQLILEHPELANERHIFGQIRLKKTIRLVLDSLRGQLLEGDNADLSLLAILGQIRRSLTAPPFGLREVVNATGILLHTGLGRAPLAEEALSAAIDVARGYSNLEYDLETGERGHRTTFVQALLVELTGAEAATVVNNNAAATVLALRALAQGGEVLVSRGELVEIGGSYRLPEIFEASGAKLREVGTTNKTRMADYTRAIGPETRAILRVHPSNYRIVGFTESTPLSQLAQLARDHDLWLIDDLGSGVLTPGLYPEVIDDPTARDGINAGADLVLFSGDKLLGGPQCGVILGSSTAMKLVESDPLMRAFRVDKLTLATLQATLQLILDGRADQSIPLWLMLKTPLSQLQDRAEQLAKVLHAEMGLAAAAVASTAFLGGGSMPVHPLPSAAVRVDAPFPGGRSASEWVRALRMGQPAIVSRIHNGGVWFDVRSVPASVDARMIDAIRKSSSI